MLLPGSQNANRAATAFTAWYPCERRFGVHTQRGPTYPTHSLTHISCDWIPMVRPKSSKDRPPPAPSAWRCFLAHVMTYSYTAFKGVEKTPAWHNGPRPVPPLMALRAPRRSSHGPTPSGARLVTREALRSHGAPWLHGGF